MSSPAENLREESGATSANPGGFPGLYDETDILNACAAASVQKSSGLPPLHAQPTAEEQAEARATERAHQGFEEIWRRETQMPRRPIGQKAHEDLAAMRYAAKRICDLFRNGAQSKAQSPTSSVASYHNNELADWDCEPIDDPWEDYSLYQPDALDDDWPDGSSNSNPTPKNASRVQAAPKGQSKEPTVEVPLPTQDSLNAFVYQHLGFAAPEKSKNPQNDVATAIFSLALNDLRMCQKLYPGNTPEITDHDRACKYVQRPAPKIVLIEGLKQMYFGIQEKLKCTPQSERLKVVEVFKSAFLQAKLANSELLIWKDPEAMLAAFTIFRYLAQNNGEDPIKEWKKLENQARKKGSKSKGPKPQDTAQTTEFQEELRWAATSVF
ncbi:hypothetical protein KBD81_03055 [Candidatus Woesebacteria bacterium]|nr:hypothetical protein [Candidatus Woesebacteria bacterium]